MKREQLTNVTTESIDERCAMLAGRAEEWAWDWLRNSDGSWADKRATWANNPHRIIDAANTIIALRSQQVTP